MSSAMDNNKLGSNISNDHQVVRRTGSQGSTRSGRRRSSISGSRKASLVITPETVPQFVIPSLGNPQPRRASATAQASPDIIYAQDIRRHHSFTEALLRTDNTGLWPAIGPILIAAQHSRKDSTDDESENNELQVPFTKERSSSDASSRYLMPPTWDNLGECRKATSDPGFQLSMTLSHLSVVTPYGFPTLSSAPKTDRKESLLLSQPAPSKPSKNASASASTPVKSNENGPSNACSIHIPDNNNNSNNKITVETRRRFVRQLTNDSSVSSSVSTCSAASETWEDSDDAATGMTGVRSVSELSSSTDSDTACGPHSTASSPENSPTNSPAKRGKFRRCHTITGTTPPSFRRKRLSDAGKDGRAQTLQHLHLHCARQGQSKDLGEIHLSFNYDRTFKLLKVIMQRAENVGRGDGASSEEVSSFAKIYLMPGKRQPQQTRLITNTCDPEFNEIFYYKNISLTDLRSCQLRVKLLRSKRSGLGEAWIPLGHLEHQPVMLVREDLQPKSRSEAPGQLSLSLCYQPRTNALTVTIVKAQNLPKTGIRGTPDPQVKIELTQIKGNELDTQTKQTKIKWKTSCPIFKEAFKFDLTESQNVQDGLTLVCTVVNGDPFRRGTPIGHIRLGLGSTQDTEVTHWETIMKCPGQPIMQWHNLADTPQS